MVAQVFRRTHVMLTLASIGIVSNVPLTGCAGASAVSFDGTDRERATAVSSGCGAQLGNTCAADEYCNFPDNYCGAADGPGVCAKRPQFCPENVDPVCGCDNVVHENPCRANAAGADVFDIGLCEAPQGKFSCGSKFCVKATEYCQIEGMNIGPNRFSCHALPTTCGDTPDCACLAQVPCGNICRFGPDDASDVGLRVICPAH